MPRQRLGQAAQGAAIATPSVRMPDGCWYDNIHRRTPATGFTPWLMPGQEAGSTTTTRTTTTMIGTRAHTGGERSDRRPPGTGGLAGRRRGRFDVHPHQSPKSQFPLTINFQSGIKGGADQAVGCLRTEETELVCHAWQYEMWVRCSRHRTALPERTEK